MNKKIIVIVVIVECALAILLVSVLGKAIETFYSEIESKSINFVSESGEVLENDSVIQVKLTDSKRGYQLHWVIGPENTSEKSVTFSVPSNKAEKVEVSADGYVSFWEDTDVAVTVTTKNGKSATVTLVPERKSSGNVVID